MRVIILSGSQGLVSVVRPGDGINDLDLLILSNQLPGLTVYCCMPFNFANAGLRSQSSVWAVQKWTTPKVGQPWRKAMSPLSKCVVYMGTLGLSIIVGSTTDLRAQTNSC